MNATVASDGSAPCVRSQIDVGITTRNRPESLRHVIESLACIAPRIAEVLIFDDASEVPVEAQLNGAVAPVIAGKVAVIRAEGNVGQQRGRNRLIERACADLVLLLDDDASLLDARGVTEACAVMERDARVAVVAFAQATADGAAWPPAMQASPADYPCYVPAFIGFAHLVRREPFLRLGGYRQTFFYHGEEKELCLRLLNAGLDVVYLPRARVAHLVDPGGRDRIRYLRYVTRNDCLTAFYNDPLWRLCWTVPGRLFRYFRMKRGVPDPGGFTWLLRELWSVWPTVWAERRPLAAATFRRWRELRDTSPAYDSPRPSDPISR